MWNSFLFIFFFKWYFFHQVVKCTWWKILWEWMRVKTQHSSLLLYKNLFISIIAIQSHFVCLFFSFKSPNPSLWDLKSYYSHLLFQSTDFAISFCFHTFTQRAKHFRKKSAFPFLACGGAYELRRWRENPGQRRAACCVEVVFTHNAIVLKALFASFSNELRFLFRLLRPPPPPEAVQRTAVSFQCLPSWIKNK